jgi:hypothetical protein
MCNNFKQITSQGFLFDVFNVHRIPHDYRFIDVMGLNFFNDDFSIKSTFLKVKGRYNHQNKFAYVIIFVNFINVNFFKDKMLINTTFSKQT